MTLGRDPVQRWAGMATLQFRDRWRMASWALLTGLLFAARRASGCHPASRELHICLNIYLERDFHHVESIVEGHIRVAQQGGGHAFMEGNDLLDICKHISSLRSCYAPLVRECRDLWQLHRFPRVLNVLEATNDYLCAGGTVNLQDILLNSGCLAKTNLASCTGFDWWMSWRKVLRMEVSPQETCVALKTYRDCLQQHLANVLCGSEANRVYMPLFDVWLKIWCMMGSTSDEDRRHLYDSLNTLNEILEISKSI